MWSLFVSSLMMTLLSVQAVIMEEEASPYHYGNYVESLVSFNIGTHRIPSNMDNSTSMHVYVVAPNCTTDTTLPIFYFYTAFAGKVPSQMYNEFLRHIARSS